MNGLGSSSNSTGRTFGEVDKDKVQSRQTNIIDKLLQDWMQVDEIKTENVSIDDLIMDGYSKVVSFFKKPVP